MGVTKPLKEILEAVYAEVLCVCIYMYKKNKNQLCRPELEKDLLAETKLD